MNELHIGTRFDTPHEYDCLVTSLPDADGSFTALDSDGVECYYHVAMISKVYESAEEGTT
jgi:hypothetical protein